MSGLITTIFKPGEGEEAMNSSDTEIDAAGDAGLELSPEITLETGGTYEGLDGTTTTWSNDTTLAADVDVAAVFAAGANLTSDETSGE